MTEQEILSFLERFLPQPPGQLVKGVGDDCAVVEEGERALLLTVDAMIEGVHFDLAYFSPLFLGRKLAAVNLSDVAAMGGEPRFALLTLGLPRGPEKAFLEEFFRGLSARLREFGAYLVGGDCVRSREICLSLSLLGEAPRGEVVFRQGARPGDWLFVSRPLGASAMALERLQEGRSVPESLLKAHLDPDPEITLGRALAQEGLVSAMMDVSDGLLLDLARLCQASQVGAELFAEGIPLPAVEIALSRPPLDYALAGGEDFALLFSVPPEKEETLRALARRLGRQVFKVGRCLAEKGLFLRQHNQRSPLAPEGFDHFS